MKKEIAYKNALKELNKEEEVLTFKKKISRLKI